MDETVIDSYLYGKYGWSAKGQPLLTKISGGRYQRTVIVAAQLSISGLGVFLNGIYFKVKKDSKVINKCVYSVLEINSEGKKEILGIWISETESGSFWTCVCNKLKNQGMQDILLTCQM